MNLINRSYSDCIKKGCQKLPTLVFDIQTLGLLKNPFTTQILSCTKHEEFTRREIHNRFPGHHISVCENPIWLRDRQVRERARRSQEGSKLFLEIMSMRGGPER